MSLRVFLFLFIPDVVLHSCNHCVIFVVIQGPCKMSLSCFLEPGNDIRGDYDVQSCLGGNFRLDV